MLTSVNTMGITVEEFVRNHVSELGGRQPDLDRVVTVPSGLSPEGMMQAIGHPDVGRLGIPMMADFMAPEGSLYYDAIFGAFHGQSAIRKWLVPAMSEIEFIDFVPTAEAAWFDDGLGGSSLDEWQMMMNLDGQRIPLSRGVSVRRYRDGWITWACDVYDTAALRVPPPPDMGGPPPPPLPPVPRLAWSTDGSVGPTVIADPRRIDAPLHPTDSVYFDPVAGELRGPEAIAGWLAGAVPAAADAHFEAVGPLLCDGTTSVQEWKLVADGEPVPLRGTSVRRLADGYVVYAADYYDTAHHRTASAGEVAS